MIIRWGRKGLIANALAFTFVIPAPIYLQPATLNKTIPLASADEYFEQQRVLIENFQLLTELLESIYERLETLELP